MYTYINWYATCLIEGMDEAEVYHFVSSDNCIGCFVP
jgi:hypothetical protein